MGTKTMAAPPALGMRQCWSMSPLPPPAPPPTAWSWASWACIWRCIWSWSWAWSWSCACDACVCSCVWCACAVSPSPCCPSAACWEEEEGAGEACSGACSCLTSCFGTGANADPPPPPLPLTTSCATAGTATDPIWYIASSAFASRSSCRSLANSSALLSAAFGCFASACFAVPCSPLAAEIAWMGRFFDCFLGAEWITATLLRLASAAAASWTASAISVSSSVASAVSVCSASRLLGSLATVCVVESERVDPGASSSSLSSPSVSFSSTSLGLQVEKVPSAFFVLFFRPIHGSHSARIELTTSQNFSKVQEAILRAGILFISASHPFFISTLSSSLFGSRHRHMCNKHLPGPRSSPSCAACVKAAGRRFRLRWNPFFFNVLLSSMQLTPSRGPPVSYLTTAGRHVERAPKMLSGPFRATK
mmetsp:Transcript_21396/g.50717  ORF Transcript_21396/g.50717 Transcript_21396/m.50717 type:complete len:421 (+) Transcript_21396:245-1507(+)